MAKVVKGPDSEQEILALIPNRTVGLRQLTHFPVPSLVTFRLTSQQTLLPLKQKKPNNKLLQCCCIITASSVDVSAGGSKPLASPQSYFLLYPDLVQYCSSFQAEV